MAATIRERKRKDGGITYTVLWRAGGKAGAKQESEIFPDSIEKAADKAVIFKSLVDMHGQQWPPGWVRGKGFVQAEPNVPTDPPFIDWARACNAKTEEHVSSRVFKNRTQHIDRHFPRLVHRRDDGTTEPATVDNITSEDLTRWANTQRRGVPDPAKPGRWLIRPAAPSSIQLRLNLASGYFEKAMSARPKLRDNNPCGDARLSRLDDGQLDQEMCFLSAAEYERIRYEILRTGRAGEEAADLADVLVGTGLRWGEATALKVKDLRLDDAEPTLTVSRTWRREADNTYTLQAPKTARSRRTIDLSRGLVELLRRRSVGKSPDDLLLTTVGGAAWRDVNFRKKRWKPAVDAAIAGGLPRRPRIHDLRHTHVAWLIAEKVPLPAIQARLGHRSITTTIDRYGHLDRRLGAEIAAAVDRSLPVFSDGGLRLVG
ncbi:site-specific recombinase XerD [Streptomyces sp. TLI_235]|nr:site-specific integrase [Streptomyces sp. TLI_235]PBC71515.1 site-specific recombinase XerD [Streptomyces sp. TLI_235]